MNDVIDSDLRVPTDMLPRCPKCGAEMREASIRTTAELIRHADAVLVGSGSGLSSAVGYNHYHHNTVFQKNFHDFEEAYGIQSLFQGFCYIYSKPEQQWKF